MLRINSLDKKYDRNSVVSRFHLSVEAGEFVVFVGPSGCGKSTVLKMIAGLEEISGGEIWINGKLANYKKPQERNISMVFQNYALYPHMTVFQNMGFCLKIKGTPKQEIEKKVRKMAELLEISALLEKKPATLSGGQRQRVAIGNALIKEASLYLMDEPLSNLDTKLRTQMRVELAELHQKLKSTIIYVTHDQVEAMTLADRIVVMDKGNIQQIGTPEEIYQRPANQFVAGFFGTPSMNFIKGVIRSRKEGICLEIEGKRLAFNQKQSRQLYQSQYVEEEVIMGVRPECLTIHTEDNSGDSLPFTIELKEELGAETLLYGWMGDSRFCISTDQKSQNQCGDIINVGIRMDTVHLFDMRTEQNIFYGEGALS